MLPLEDAHLLFLPQYSPNLNPIEQVFAKLKALLRKAAERTVDTVCQRIGELLDAFTLDNACQAKLSVAAVRDTGLSPQEFRKARPARRAFSFHAA